MNNPGFYVDYWLNAEDGTWSVELFNKDNETLVREDRLADQATARQRAIEILQERLGPFAELKESVE